MKMKTIIVVCAALAAGSTFTIQAQQAEWKPAQGAIKEPNAEFLRLQVRPVEGRLVKGAPYSAEITNETVQTLGDGNRIVQKTTGRVYRDAEGRVRREDDRPSGTPSISITDPVANKSYTLDAVNRTARETPGFRFATASLFGEYVYALQEVTRRPAVIPEVPTAAAAGSARGGGGGGAASGGTAAGAAAAGAGGGGRGGRIAGSQDPQSAASAVAGGRGGRASAVPTTAQAAPARGAGGGGRGGGAGRRDDRVEETLPNRSIEGVMCSGIRRTTTIAKDAIGNDLPIKIVSEEWTSVDLGVLVLTDTNDPRTSRSTYKLTNINRRDPDPSLFKVPGDYTIQGAGGRGRGGNH